MKVRDQDKPILLSAINSILADLPHPPIEWALVGSIKKFGLSYHDIDLCLLYDRNEAWMQDKYIKLPGIPLKFDLFFYTPPNQEEWLRWEIEDLRNQRKEFFGNTLSEAPDTRQGHGSVPHE